MRRYPHLTNAPEFPGAGRDLYEQIPGSFDYDTWGEGAKLTVTSVPWGVYAPGIATDRPGFDTEKQRDEWFSQHCAKTTSETHYLETRVRYQINDYVEVGFTFDYASRYNYLIVEYPNAPVPYGTEGIRKWYFHITEIKYDSPSCTTLMLIPDWWVTVSPFMSVNHMILERGHAPLANSSVSDYLSAPLENSEYLLSPDVDFGGRSIVAAHDDIVFNSGDVYAVICLRGVPIDGDFSGYKMPFDNSTFANGVPSGYSFCLPAGDLAGFLDAWQANAAQSMQALEALYFVGSKLLQMGGTFNLWGYTLHAGAQGKRYTETFTLSEQAFGFADNLKHLAKLYTYPYSFIEISDERGEVTEIRIENLTEGKIQIESALNGAFPWLSVSAHVTGYGGKRSALTFATAQQEEFGAGGFWYDTLKSWGVPCYKINQSAAQANDYHTHYSRLQRAADAKVAYDNAVNSAETANENALASNATANANTLASNATANENALASNSTSNANSLAANKTANENALASNSTANANALASNATANTNALASNETANANALASNAASYNNALASNATANANALASNATANENALAVNDNARANVTNNVNNMGNNNAITVAMNNTLTSTSIEQGYKGVALANTKLRTDTQYDIGNCNASFDADMAQLAVAATNNDTQAAAGVISGAISMGAAVVKGDLGGGLDAMSGIINTGANWTTTSASIAVSQSNNTEVYDQSITSAYGKQDAAISYGANSNGVNNAALTANNTTRNDAASAMCKNNQDCATANADANKTIADANANRSKGTADANANRSKGTGDANAERSKTTADGNANRSKDTADGNANLSKETADANANRSKSTGDANANRSKTTADGNANRSKTTEDENANRVKSTGDANANRSKDTGNANANRSKDAAISNALNSYENAIAAIASSVSEASMKAPVSYGIAQNGEFSNTRPMMLSVNVVTESKSAIRQAAAQFLRFGYALNQPWDFESWNLMQNFTYWKVSDVWATGAGAVPEEGQDAFRRMLYDGVTLWSDPDKIGKVSIYDN